MFELIILIALITLLVCLQAIVHEERKTVNQVSKRQKQGYKMCLQGYDRDNAQAHRGATSPLKHKQRGKAFRGKAGTELRQEFMDGESRPSAGNRISTNSEKSKWVSL